MEGNKKLRCCSGTGNRNSNRGKKRGREMKVLIIGGVAAGTKTAEKFKREERSTEGTGITRDQEISYAGCGLPYYVGGFIERRG